MPEDVAATVHARTLAIPNADDAFHFAFPDHLVDLAPHNRGSRQILVNAWAEVDIVLGKQFAGAGQSHVIAAQR